MRGNGVVNHSEKVLGGHIGRYFATTTIATAMQTMHIAAQRTLPKELLQWMQLLKVLPPQSLQLQYDSFANIHAFTLYTLNFQPSTQLPYFFLSLKSERIE